ncbi:MAG: hypothetical protein IPJ03_14640 [Ignavibacteriales bacterium]|nr:hypothetical protein [Ignavibacteriales bacterium]
MTYVKGACVLHQLKYVIGDDKFFEGIMNYAADPNLKYHSAVTSDLQENMSYLWRRFKLVFDEWILNRIILSTQMDIGYNQPVQMYGRLGFQASKPNQILYSQNAH